MYAVCSCLLNKGYNFLFSGTREHWKNSVQISKRFVEWLMSKFYEDAELKECVGIFQEKCKHLPVDVFTKEVRRATSISLRQDEIEKMLNSLYISEKRLTDVYKPDTSSEEVYIELENLIRSDERNILLNSLFKDVLKYLKTTMTNKSPSLKASVIRKFQSRYHTATFWLHFRSWQKHIHRLFNVFWNWFFS